MAGSASQDVIVIGAGVIGGAIALALSRRGVRVTMLERGQIGGEASGAAAGILAPQAEMDHPSSLFDFGIACRNRYREWVEAASDESGVAVDFRPDGLLHLAVTEEAAIALKARGDWQKSTGLRAEWIAGSEARDLEPDLRRGLAGALMLPDEASVDPVALTRAMAIAARSRGARIEEHVAVSSLIMDGGQVRGVEAGNTRYSAGCVVIAAGAWSSRIAGIQLEGDWIEPCRGQTVVVRRGVLRIRHILYTHGAYAVPRGARDLILGTTVEHIGFERHASPGGVRSIVDAVARFAPAIGDAEMVRSFVGFRPESRDGMPLIGPSAALPGLVFATGHFRNGILLAPLTGELVAEAIASGKTPPELRPFLPDRAQIIPGTNLPAGEDRRVGGNLRCPSVVKNDIKP